MDRRKFLASGAAIGAGIGTIGAMGVFSYSPMRKAVLPEVARGTTDIGVCKSVKVINISETSWFDNGVFMQDVTGAGGLLVDQYTYNWPPFGNGKGPGKGTYADGMKVIEPFLQKGDLKGAWEAASKLSEHPDNAGGYACLIEVEAMDGKKTRYLMDCGWNYEWMDTCFKREGIDKMLQNHEIKAFISTHEHMDHYWGFP